MVDTKLVTLTRMDYVVCARRVSELALTLAATLIIANHACTEIVLVPTTREAGDLFPCTKTGKKVCASSLQRMH